MTLTILCSNRRCRRKSETLVLRSQTFVCLHCGTGKRVRVDHGPHAYRISLTQLEPPDDDPKQQALNSGALMAGWL
jgi:hypothetical protein